MPDIASLIVDPTAWTALATLVVMEIVLGVDNLVFVAVLSNRIAESSRACIRRVGLALALVFRLGLLASVVALASLTAPLFSAFGHPFSARDITMLAGGLFLIWKATHEIHMRVEPGPEDGSAKGAKPLGNFAAIAQIVLLDLVFSIDSIVTAVGMTNHIVVMFMAVIIAVAVMIVAVGPVASFIHRNPTVVMLALSFLVMIGMTLIAEGFEFEVPKGYIYAAMLFSGLVEGLNGLARRARKR
jgi:predicted tellurium resistance membrane protein TerC